MPLQVSYKKQFVFFILLIVIFLATIEVLVNIWLYTIYRCDFEDNEIFKNVDPETNRKICIESLGYDTSERITWVQGTAVNPAKGGLDEKIVHFNSHGFRGVEFTKEKDENVYRLFTIGGSTTFGVGVLDNQTWPFYLQELYEQNNPSLTVEVINAGYPGKWSKPETILIKNQLLAFEPDLFIIYDGVNDLIKDTRDNPGASAKDWGKRWMEICEIGTQQGFDTIITLQPDVASGKKFLTKVEYKYKILSEGEKTMENYPLYIEQLDALKNKCSLTADLRSLFNDEKVAIFFDKAHTGPTGNQIIAQKFYSLSLPFVITASEKLDINSENETSSSIEINSKLLSNDANVFLDEFYHTLSDWLSLYKTPKIASIIFKD